MIERKPWKAATRLHLPNGHISRGRRLLRHTPIAPAASTGPRMASCLRLIDEHSLDAAWKNIVFFDGRVVRQILHTPWQITTPQTLSTTSFFPRAKSLSQRSYFLTSTTTLTSCSSDASQNKQFERKVSIAAKSISQRHFAVAGMKTATPCRQTQSST